VIVEPDFFHHWKTRELIRLLKDDCAPLYVLRLWAHCQSRKMWKFALSDGALGSICGYPHSNPENLRKALSECSFIDQNGAKLFTVHDWDKSNRYLVSAWKNGSKGGRSQITDRIPTGNRSVSRPLTGPSNLSNLSNQSVQEEGNGEKPPNLVPTCEDVYNAYPRHEARPEALKAIARAIGKGFGAATLLERTMAYAKTQPPRSQFTPLPATWFNQERFNDDPQEWTRREPPKVQQKIGRDPDELMSDKLRLQKQQERGY